MTLREQVEKAVALLRQGFHDKALTALERALQAPETAPVTTASGLELAFDPHARRTEPIPEFSVGDSFINIKNEGWIVPEDVVEEMGAFFRDLFRKHKGDTGARNLIHMAVHTRLHQLVDSGRIRRQ